MAAGDGMMLMICACCCGLLDEGMELGLRINDEVF